jgi:hypothetical protein
MPVLPAHKRFFSQININVGYSRTNFTEVGFCKNVCAEELSPNSLNKKGLCRDKKRLC